MKLLERKNRIWLAVIIWFIVALLVQVLNLEDIFPKDISNVIGVFAWSLGIIALLNIWINIVDKIIEVYKIRELRDRISLTLGLLVVYRFGAQVVLPGINVNKLGSLTTDTESGLLGLLNAFTGGAFANASVFALGIMPYISASIVVQLMGIAVPYLQKLQKEGASGQKKITQITRWLTIAICLIQAPGYLYALPNAFGVEIPDSLMFDFSSIVILVTGCVFAMWLGEKITDKGVGNGISLLITVGIIATLPQAFVQEWVSRREADELIMISVEIVVWIATILASVMLVMAVRKIAVQYARRNSSGSFERNVAGSRQYIPLRLNASGVMPIIFAQALMFIPMSIGGISFLKDTSVGQFMITEFGNIFGVWYNVVFGLLIIVFTFFYTAITVPTNKIADDLNEVEGLFLGLDLEQTLQIYLTE